MENNRGMAYDVEITRIKRINAGGIRQSIGAYTENIPRRFKINPLFVETKSKRLQLVVRPSLLKKIKAAAKRNDVSANELIHTILELAFENEGDLD